MNQPKVSVLIPTYNYGAFIGQAIKSVLAQTFSDYELIIVDNASTDDTERIVKQFSQDKRITYHKNNTNIGLVANWNKCLDLANGKYVKFLCADDHFHPMILEQFVAKMEEYPSVSLVACFRKVYGAVDKLLTIPLHHYQKGRDMIYSTIHSYHWLGEPSSTMFRKSDIEKIGQFNTAKYQFLDLDLYFRLLTIGDCYIIPEELAFIYSHNGQVTTTNMSSYRFTFEDYELFKDLRDGNGYSIDVSDMNIDIAIRQKATMCAKAMYKMLPKLHQKESREIFKKAFKIASKERVLLSPLINSLKNRITEYKNLIIIILLIILAYL
ncbi:MAG: glycosyltransferase family 2 protein [Flavobacterium sp.]|nr:MAG: glycosyltransferase family 2 protein [Flavobacterium sp.]